MSNLFNELMNSTYDEKFIYHYTNFTAAIRIIESKKLKLSKLTNLNDPNEFLFPSSYSMRNNFNNKLMFNRINQFKTALRKVYIFCSCSDVPIKKLGEKDFTQEKTATYFNKGWARNRMWTQYADQHRGVCLIFNKDELKSCFISTDRIKIIGRQVYYTNYEKDLSMNIDITTDKDYKNYFLEEENIKRLFSKCQDFRDEYEYRLCLIDKKLKSPEEEKFIDYGSSLKGIICGIKFDNETDLKIIKKLKSKKTELFYISWNGNPNLNPY